MAQKKFKEAFVNQLTHNLRKGDPKTVRQIKTAPMVYSDSDVLLIDSYPDMSKLILQKKGEGDDFQFNNAVNLYNFLQITPYQASDPSLWTFLALVTFRSYMDDLRSKIPAEDHVAAGRYLLSHYFCVGSSVKDLLLNDISLLWWAAHLTVQSDSKDDRFRLTKEVFRMLDYTRHLLPGIQGRSEAFRHGVLEFIVENENLFRSKREGKVRLIMRRLNMYAGYQLFPSFSKAEVKEFIAGLSSEIADFKQDEQ